MSKSLPKEIKIGGQVFGLNDMKAKPSSFTVIAPDGNEIKLHLRPITMKDESWIKDNIGEKEFQNALESAQIEKIMSFVFHQLTFESKQLIRTIKFMDMDEDGKEFEVEVSKLSEKLQYLIAGYENAYNLYQAVLQARGLSMPLLDKVTEEQIKKNEVSKQPMEQEEPKPQEN